MDSEKLKSGSQNAEKLTGAELIILIQRCLFLFNTVFDRASDSVKHVSVCVVWFKKKTYIVYYAVK